MKTIYIFFWFMVVPDGEIKVHYGNGDPRPPYGHITSQKQCDEIVKEFLENRTVDHHAECMALTPEDLENPINDYETDIWQEI